MSTTMTPAATSSSSNKSSPKLCLLLKTLLFLLCIYIKRVTAAPTLTASTSELKPHIVGDLRIDHKLVDAGELAFDLVCPVDKAVKFKSSNYARNQTLKQLREEIIENTQVTWFKNDKPLHRENGELMLNNLSDDGKSFVLLKLGQSDEGLYTCMLNYSNVRREAFKYFEFHRSISFPIYINLKEHTPDTKPTITHPPANLLVNRGSDTKFTCNGIDTLTHQTVYWFKSCINQTCNQKFKEAYTKAERDGDKSELKNFTIKNGNEDKLDLYNVSDKDIGYYGCLVENARGIDIRLGQLDLVEALFESKSVINTLPPFQSDLDQNQLNSSIVYPILEIESNSTSRIQSNHAHAYFGATPESKASSSGAEYSYITWHVIGLMMLIALAMAVVFRLVLHCSKKLYSQREKKPNQNGLGEPIVGNIQVNIRQHLPNGDCPDIYNIGKATDGFISGLHQSNGLLMSQSICTKMLDEEKNPSISSNSNSDEASSWGKSMSSHGDNSRAFYLHTSNTTTTTVPMYDHPPSTGAAHQSGALVQDACVINPTYGFIRPESDANTWAFPRRNLERLNKIGEGQFGEVWRYIARQKDGKESYVAVKQLKNRAGLGDRERLELIAEIEIMKSINNHPNVIKLLNYCADECEPLLLIMEYAEHGKLQTYLRNCRTMRKTYGFPNDCSSFVTSKELIKFSYHIAKGMEYVASKGIVHRDLASRNILVSKEKVCKVADFGFARRVTDECAYERTTANPVPVKWMAPEALVENKFTSKSDVFSLGILMWEIVTLGATPYEYLTSVEVYKKVTSGGRLERPVHCKDEFYNIMARCWLHDPSQRPTFKELACQLEKLLLSENDYIELDQYPEHAYYNILNIEEKEIVHITP